MFRQNCQHFSTHFWKHIESEGWFENHWSRLLEPFSLDDSSQKWALNLYQIKQHTLPQWCFLYKDPFRLVMLPIAIFCVIDATANLLLPVTGYLTSTQIPCDERWIREVLPKVLPNTSYRELTLWMSAMAMAFLRSAFFQDSWNCDLLVSRKSLELEERFKSLYSLSSIHIIIQIMSGVMMVASLALLDRCWPVSLLRFAVVMVDHLVGCADALHRFHLWCSHPGI